MRKIFLPVLAAILFVSVNGCKKNEISPKIDSNKYYAALPKGPTNATYKIINATTYLADVNAAMEVAGVSNADGANIQQWAFFPNGGQTWEVTAVSDGYYKIINTASGKALEVPDGSNTPGTQLKQKTFTGTDNQLWQIEQQPQSTYAFKIKSKLNNLLVTLENNLTTNGAKILQRPAGEAGQYWLLLRDVMPVDNSTPVKTITWSPHAYKISHSGIGNAEYARVHRVNSTTLILTYHFGTSLTGWEDIAIRRSTNNGLSWGAPHVIKHTTGYWGFSTPETIVLRNGWIMLAFVGRGRPDINANSNVQICLSKDGGITWSAPKIIATGRSWEPAMVQLFDGEIELFYSSEAAWWPSDNVQQEILLVRSRDNGNSWTAPQRVAYTTGKRDGMPVPLVLKDNKGIVFPVESVNASQSAWMNWSSIYSRWRYADGVASTANGRRWLATTAGVWGGAPYIIQLPAGETILSVHDAGGRAIPHWRKSTQIVMMGNSMAKNFTNATYPWPNLPVDEGAIENGLFLRDSVTVMTVTSRIYADGHSEVYWKGGRVH